MQTLFIYARPNGSAVHTPNYEFGRTMLRKFFGRPLVKGKLKVTWKPKNFNKR
jgi:hypothetical protein